MNSCAEPHRTHQGPQSRRLRAGRTDGVIRDRSGTGYDVAKRARRGVAPVSKSHASPTTPSAGDAASPKGRPVGPVAAPPRPEIGTGQSSWTASRITALVIGALLVLVSLVLLGGGGTALWADRTHRDAGYITTDVHKFSTLGSALVTEPTDLGSVGTGWLYSPTLLDKVRIRVTPVSPGSALFVGIGPSTDVDRYLAGVNHTLITDFWTDSMQPMGGSTPGSAPGTQNFWVATDTGTGSRTLTWDPTAGSWSVVVLNTDALPGVDVEADLGATMPALLWIAVGVLAAGMVFGVGGVLLIAGATRRASRARTA